MVQQLKQVLYISRPSRDFNEEDMLNMLSCFRENNVECEITGLLIQGKHKFLQYLEGPAEEIDDLMGKITADERHNDVLVLSEGDLKTRLFSEWLMAFSPPKKLGRKQLPGYSQLLNPSADRSKIDITSLELLRLFKDAWTTLAA